MDYRILESYGKEELESLVMGWLKIGWKLQGGVSCYYDPHREHVCYVQAISQY
jgi:hypothetical protein